MLRKLRTLRRTSRAADFLPCAGETTVACPTKNVEKNNNADANVQSKSSRASDVKDRSEGHISEKNKSTKDVKESPPAYSEDDSQLEEDELGHQALVLQQPTYSNPYPILNAFNVFQRKADTEGNPETGPLNELFRYGLRQIMVDTFHVDIGRLQRASAVAHQNPAQKQPWFLTILDSQGQSPTSILTKTACAALKELCTLVRTLEQALDESRWPAVSEWEKVLLVNCVLRPAHKKNIPADYILELFGRYRSGEFMALDSDWVDTMLDYWTPDNGEDSGVSNSSVPALLGSPASWQDLGDTLASHSSLLNYLQTPEICLDIIGDAMTKFKEERGIQKLPNSPQLHNATLAWHYDREDLTRTACLWPVSYSYRYLYSVLSDGAPEYEMDAEALEQRVRMLGGRENAPRYRGRPRRW